MDSVPWVNFDTAFAGIAPTSETVPGVETSDLLPLVDDQQDPMLSCLSPTVTEHEWKSLFSECANAPQAAASNIEAGKLQDVSEAANIGAFPEALTVANSTVNIHLQPQKELESVTRQRLERMEVHICGLQKTLVRLDASLSAMQNECLGMRVAQAQILETMKKMMKGLDKFFIHVAFDAGQSPA